MGRTHLIASSMMASGSCLSARSRICFVAVHHVNGGPESENDGRTGSRIGGEGIVDELGALVAHAVARRLDDLAYGSGVFAQHGDKGKPMLDFMFAVTHPAHWHSINLGQNPAHYPLHARALGSSFVAGVQAISPGVWYNAFVPVAGTVSLLVGEGR